MQAPEKFVAKTPQFVTSKIIFVTLLSYALGLWNPPALQASPACDSLRAQPCEGETCLAKYKAIQDCETKIIAEEQERRRRRQLQRQRDYQKKLKKEQEAIQN
jgi:hypothetical protein